MPTVRISPLTEAQYFDNNGDPLNGGKLFFYQGGSFTVQKTTYNSNTGTTPNPNPIVLDSSGRPTASAFMVVDELYNVQLTAPDGTTVLNAWANVQVSTTGGGGGGGGGTPALPYNSIQYNNSGAFGGSSTLTYNPTTQTMAVGDSVTNTTSIAGTTATISVSQTTRDITLLPGSSGGYVVVGSTAADGLIEGTLGQDLYVSSDQFLYLRSINEDVIMSLGANTASKVTVQGPTAQQYATGLADADLVNKYYVDTAGGGGGGGSSTLTPVLVSNNYTTVLSDNQKMIVLDVPANPTTTITIDASLAYPEGTTITFYNNSIQTMLIALSSGTMIQVQTGFTGTRTLTGYGLATAIKVKSVGNLWTINGAGLV